MKKQMAGLLFVVATLFSSGAMSAGQYDGVWQIAGDTTYQMFYQQGTGSFLSVSLSPNNGALNGAWSQTGLGTISGNVASMSVTNADGSIKSITVTFTSLTAATLTVNSCFGSTCAAIPIGTIMQVSKVY